MWLTAFDHRYLDEHVLSFVGPNLTWNSSLTVFYISINY